MCTGPRKARRWLVKIRKFARSTGSMAEVPPCGLFARLAPGSNCANKLSQIAPEHAQTPMSTSSRPPGQPQRKLVLRRKVPLAQDSPPGGDRVSSTPPPPPTLLPRTQRPIEHPPSFGSPRPTSGFDGGLGAPASGSPADTRPTPRSVATPLPLPSRISVPPVVATVPARLAPSPPAHVQARSSRLWGAGAAVALAGALAAGGLLWVTRMQPRAGASVTAPAVEVVRPTARPAAVQNDAPHLSANADRATSVEDLPKASVPRHVPVASPMRSLRGPTPAPVGSTTAGTGGEAPSETAQAAPSASAAAAASAAASAAPEVPEVELPSVPPPPADPLIQAVQQSISDDRAK
jgi:hypothetical protein